MERAPFEESMRAAVYTGQRLVSVREIPIPRIGPGELLVRVESCGICHTDLKKIEYDLLPAPRIYGHETAGTVVRAGSEVRNLQPGDRVCVFHHIPCGDCFYCVRKLYAQCPVYKKVGVTAGYEPAGGGFAQYVRVMDWITCRGVEKIPDEVSFERASFVEPLNTCLKGVMQVNPQPGEVGVVLGQGPIGLLFTMLLKRLGSLVLTTDAMPSRRRLSEHFGASLSVDPVDGAILSKIAQVTENRGADFVIVAASARGVVEQAVTCSRPGSRILLFAQTSHQERIDVSGADICVGERTLLGSYSASVDLQKESARLIFSGELPVEELISHRVPLDHIVSGIQLAMHPDENSLKIIVQPQRCCS